MPFYLPKHIPSWKQGFARSAAESANPGLWKDLVGLWMPLLGPTGRTLFDLSGRHNDSAFAGTLDPATDWMATSEGIALKPENTNVALWTEYLTLPPGANSQGQTEWTLVVRLSQLSTVALGQLYWWLEAEATRHRNSIYLNNGSQNLTWRTYGDSTLDVVVAPLADPFTVSAAFVFSSSQVLKTIYIDGEYANSTSVNIKPFDASWTEVQGTMLSGLDGKCWQLLRFNRALTANEVRQLHVDPLAIVRPKAKYYPPAPGTIRGVSTLDFASSAVIEAAGELSGSTALDFAASAPNQTVGELSGSTALGCTLHGDLSDTVAVGGPYYVAAGVPYAAGSVAGQLWSTGSVSGAVHVACPVAGMVA